MRIFQTSFWSFLVYSLFSMCLDRYTCIKFFFFFSEDMYGSSRRRYDFFYSFFIVKNHECIHTILHLISFSCWECVYIYICLIHGWAHPHILIFRGFSHRHRYLPGVFLYYKLDVLYTYVFQYVCIVHVICIFCKKIE